MLGLQTLVLTCRCDPTLSYQQRTDDWYRVIEEIRHVDGFETFLKPSPYNVLQKAAKHGPVILVNVGQDRCDALIVREGEQPLLVPLPNATAKSIDDMAQTVSRVTTTQAYQAADTDQDLVVVLRQIWTDIVAPIVQQLKTLPNMVRGSRIVWCPTSSACSLPLHAAGPYEQGRRNLPDLFTSSYTPTLTTLIRCQANYQLTTRPTGPRLLVVAQPLAEGEAELPCVREEMSVIHRVVPPSQTVVLEGEQCTKAAVLAHLPTANWVHFACHGHQNRVEPFKSHFSLREQDAPLRLLDIIVNGLPNAELAVLSACHSAAGDKTTPDEAIHLAAGMLFAGYRGVVGTMWAMNDADGPVIAEVFYKYMLRNGPEAVDCRDAATALSKATRELRRRRVGLARWINFVHYGI